MHYAKIDFLIALHFQSRIVWILRQLESPNFLQKLEELEDLQNNHNKILQNSRSCFYAAQGIVVLVIFETTVNAARAVKFFSEKKNVALIAKKLQSASEYRKICVRLRSVNCITYVRGLK